MVEIMSFDLITTVRVNGDHLFSFIDDCKIKHYEFQFTGGWNVDGTSNVVVGASNLTPAKAEAYIQFCIRHNTPVESLMPA